MEHLEVPDRPDRPEQPDVVKEKSLQNNVFKNTIHVFCFRYLFFFVELERNEELTFYFWTFYKRPLEQIHLNISDTLI